MINIDVNIFDGIELESKSLAMKTGKTKSWLGEWNWVSLPADENTDKIDQAKAWCVEHFSKSAGRWFEKDSRFYFKDEKDMALFILAWSS